jgi:catechol 2,3-dioxygenase-like lactoylglutathione lyase family enzyme
MGLATLAHYSVRTTDLAASVRFYTEALGLREGFRPPFDFPGAWLYLGDDQSEYGVVHLIGSAGAGLDAYLGQRDEASLRGAGALDHIAFLATDVISFRQRLDRLGVQRHERTVPTLGLHQVFISDPSGVTIELNFPAGEAGA